MSSQVIVSWKETLVTVTCDYLAVTYVTKISLFTQTKLGHKVEILNYVPR